MTSNASFRMQEYRRGSPERHPIIRVPPFTSGSGRSPLRVYRDDDRGYGGSPGSSPPRRHREGSPGRYPGESPQRYLEGPPPGYRDSPPRRFRNPPPQYLSPEGSPPYRYAEDAPRRFGGPRVPFREEGPLPIDIDGPPPPDFLDEAPRRFSDTRRSRRHGYEPNRRFEGSNSPSPPRRYGPPPPPPGGFFDENPRRFRGTTPQADGSPPEYADEPPRRFRGTPPRPPRYESPPTNAEEARRTFKGTPPGLSSDGSPQNVDEAPRRFRGVSPIHGPDGLSPEITAGKGRRGVASAVPREFRDGSRPNYAEDNPHGFPEFADDFHAGHAEDIPRSYIGTTTLPRRPDGPPPRAPPAFRPAPSRVPPDIVDGSGGPPKLSPDVYEGRGGPPPRLSPDVGEGARKFPPDVFAAAAAGRPRTEGSSPEFADGGPYYATQNRTSPDVFEAAAVGRRPGGLATGNLDYSPPDLIGGAPVGARHDPGYHHLPYATPPREPYRPAPPPAGQGPLLRVPPGYATPQRVPHVPGLGDSPPDFIFASLPRRHPDGYTYSTPPRQTPMSHDPIFSEAVMPIELNDKLKELQPHRGNPGSSPGGGWKDFWAALIFLLHIGGVAALCVLIGLHGLTSTISNYSNSNAYHITYWFPQLAAAAIVGAVFSCVWQNAIRMAPVFMIPVTMWTGSAIMTIFGIVLVATGKTSGLAGLAFLFAGVCQALYASTVHERVPFAGEILKKVVSVCGTYPSTYAVSYGAILVSLGWLAVWIFGLSGAGLLPKHLAIMAGLAVSLTWTLQVLRNIVRVTVAGTVGLFYFQERNMPHMPTYFSLVKACTSSLGSICLGSLFVPLVESPCHTLRRINAQAGASEFMFSCVVCLLGCFEYLIPYFNKMGYIQVAMYGKPFVRASKDTFDMLHAQSVDVLVHDDLSSTILFLACGIGGSVSALVGGTWTFVAQKGLSIYISLLSFLIGFLITYIAMSVLESGVATYYVCFAEDPASLQRHDGPFYEKLWVRQMELLSPVTELTA